MAVGLSNGEVMLYDIRANKPTVVKDHQYGYPIKVRLRMLLSLLEPHLSPPIAHNFAAPLALKLVFVCFSDRCRNMCPEPFYLSPLVRRCVAVTVSTWWSANVLRGNLFVPPF